jgi:hypothetical protein
MSKVSGDNIEQAVKAGTLEKSELMPSASSLSKLNQSFEFITEHNLRQRFNLAEIHQLLDTLRPLNVILNNQDGIHYPLEQFELNASGSLDIKKTYQYVIAQMRRAGFEDIEILQWLCNETSYLIDEPMPDEVVRARENKDYAEMLKGLRHRKPPQIVKVIPLALVENHDILTLTLLLARFEESI